MTKEEARKVSVKLLMHIYDNDEHPELLAHIINADADRDLEAIYLMLEEVKQFVDKLQKCMKEDGKHAQSSSNH